MWLPHRKCCDRTTPLHSLNTPKSSLIISLKAGSDNLGIFPFSYSWGQSSKCCCQSWKFLWVSIPLPEHTNGTWCTQRHQVVKQIPQSLLFQRILTHWYTACIEISCLKVQRHISVKRSQHSDSCTSLILGRTGYHLGVAVVQHCWGQLGKFS